MTELLNGEVIQDKETQKWGYSIWLGKTTVRKILKEPVYEFKTEQDAKEKFELEFDKHLKQQMYNSN